MKFMRVVTIVVCAWFFLSSQAQASPLTEVLFETDMDFTTGKYTGNQIETPPLILAYDLTNDGVIDTFDFRSKGNNGLEQNFWTLQFSTSDINANLIPGTYINPVPFQFGPGGQTRFTARVSGLPYNTANPGSTGKFDILDFKYDYQTPGNINGIQTDRVLSFAANFEVDDPTIVDPANIFAFNSSIKGHLYYNYDIETLPPATVPEPATLFLMGGGLLGVFVRRRQLSK